MPTSNNVIEVSTQPFADQKPGTSGLRKRVKVFEERPNYTENFIQALLEAAGQPKLLVLGGDGRYYSSEAIAKILNICAANGVERLVVGQRGILSTPAASALIRSLRADGGIILTASHNPGGPEGDFGIKYNCSNGGPAPESMTSQMHAISQSLTSYKSLFKRPSVQLDQLGEQSFAGAMRVQVVDSVQNYLELMRQVFDLGLIRRALFDEASSHKLRLLVDPMNGVLGPYARRLLLDELGAPADSVINCEPLSDFGGKHPDPNLTYARELVEAMRAEAQLELGCAFDGDGDRNMILGSEAFFVTPGDSLAIIAAHLDKIKYFEGRQVCGLARSFPTAPALDRVAEARGLKLYETPTGWKYFGNLMDAELISLCGEESFGTGSVHIREKDGLWALLAWLSIMAHTRKSVRQLVEQHWQEFGRDYFCRYDFEECDALRCEQMMLELEERLVGKQAKLMQAKEFVTSAGDKYLVEETGNFEYKDPVDGSVSERQGLFVRFSGGARIIVRLSGTGSQGATVRLYVSDYSRDRLLEPSQEFLAGLLEIAYSITRLAHFTGRERPTVIT